VGKHGLIPGKTSAEYALRELQGRMLEGREMRMRRMHFLKKNASSNFYAEHNSKNRKGSFGDVTCRGLVGT